MPGAGRGSRFELEALPGQFDVCRLAPDAELPDWAAPGRGALLSIMRTDSELSIVCDGSLAPSGTERSRGWRAIRVAGTLEHTLTGVLVSLAAPLADAGIPIFAQSSFETDYLLVPADRLDRALAVLADAGHAVH
jgi:hypothetical protein